MPITLPPTPANLIDTRVALHRLATYVIAPVRYAATERFGLRATENGFGTPEFGGRRIRVRGTELIDEADGQTRSTTITSLAAAAEFLGTSIAPSTAAEHDSPPVGDENADLDINEDASLWLGDWFGVAFAALRKVGDDADSIDASPPQLWPGHFDPAIEVGDENHRGSYGASPGDDAIDEPYLYVSLWWPDRLTIDTSDHSWNAPGFVGSLLRVSDFPADADAIDVAVEFWRTGRDRVLGTPVNS